MFNKIIVGSDGSDCSRKAAELAVQVAAHFKARVLALNVFDPAYLQSMGVWDVGVSQDAMDDCIKAQVASVAKHIAPLFAERGVECQVMQELGHPAGGIVSVAKREHADLIVVGSRGLHGLKAMVLGSVSNGVLHHAPCSVLIARGENAPGAWGGFRHILLASDGSEDARKATKAALAMAQGFATSLTVLDVFDPTLYPLADADEANPNDSIGSPDLERYAAQELEGIRRDTLAEAGTTGVYCDVRQEKGHPAKTIVGFADAHKCDLIVIGSRGLGGFSEMLLGSVSSYVAHHAHCPVLVVR